MENGKENKKQVLTVDEFIDFQVHFYPYTIIFSYLIESYAYLMRFTNLRLFHFELSLRIRSFQGTTK